MSASIIDAKWEKYTTNFDLKIKNVLCLFSMSHCIISHGANGFICLSLWSCVLPTNWVRFFFFRFGNSKAKKKPSTLCVSLNSLAAPLHHCYYFEVVVYTHFFRFSLLLCCRCRRRNILYCHAHIQTHLRFRYSQCNYHICFWVCFFSFLLWREDIIWCSKHGKPWEMKQRHTNTSIGIVVCVRE